MGSLLLDDHDSGDDGAHNGADHQDDHGDGKWAGGGDLGTSGENTGTVLASACSWGGRSVPDAVVSEVGGLTSGLTEAIAGLSVSGGSVSTVASSGTATSGCRGT